MRSGTKKITFLFWLTVVSFVLLTSATFAWMSISSSLKVTDLALNVITDNALELAPDVDGNPGEWSSILMYPELLSEESTLRPVTYSAQRESFLAPAYGLDGRVDFSNPILIAKAGNNLSAADEAETAAERQNLFFFDIWVRTGAENCGVRLTEPKAVTQDVMGEGTYVVGVPAWDAASVGHVDGGTGAENAIRFGFQSYSDETGGLSSRFVIYEPNGDSSGSYLETPSVDGTSQLTDADHLIVQQASSWKEQTPVLRDHVNYSLGAFVNNNVDLFYLKAGQPRKIRVYIWLEGQDADCTNAISAAKVYSSLQFAAYVGEENKTIVPR